MLVVLATGLSGKTPNLQMETKSLSTSQEQPRHTDHRRRYEPLVSQTMKEICKSETITPFLSLLKWFWKLVVFIRMLYFKML